MILGAHHPDQPGDLYRFVEPFDGASRGLLDVWAHSRMLGNCYLTRASLETNIWTINPVHPVKNYLSALGVLIAPYGTKVS